MFPSHDIGAIPEVSNEIATIVPIEGIRTNKGYKVTDNFLNNFISACKSALYFFDNDRQYYNQISQSVSNYATETYDWKKIANVWKQTLDPFTKKTMTENCNQLQIVTPEEAVSNEEYLQQAFKEVLRWEEADKELAQGRTNFQIEKFFLLYCTPFLHMLLSSSAVPPSSTCSHPPLLYPLPPYAIILWCCTSFLHML